MPNTSRVQTAVINGTDAVPVTVECSVSEGLPSFCILGIRRDVAVELEVISRCAIKATGFEFPRRDVVVNLSPADVPKHGSHLSLPIAASILSATGQIKLPDRPFMVGELSIHGKTLQDTPGIVAYASYADRFSLHALLPCFDRLPHDLLECAEGISSLSDLRASTRFPIRPIEPEDPPRRDVPAGPVSDAVRDGRSVLVVGPRDRTDAILRDVPSMLEPLDYDESIELASICSIAEPGFVPSVLGLKCPVRRPDPSTSLAGLLGGGMPVRPGEVTLAHHGVLAIDDLGQWKPSTLRQIDAARRDRHVRIVRQEGIVTMPSAFQLAAAVQPCPCGHYGDRGRECTCESQQVMTWQRRIEGMSATLPARICIASISIR